MAICDRRDRDGDPGSVGPDGDRFLEGSGAGAAIADTAGGQLHSGTSEIQRDLIAARPGL